jgi:hypothetical protein
MYENEKKREYYSLGYVLRAENLLQRILTPQACWRQLDLAMKPVQPAHPCRLIMVCTSHCSVCHHIFWTFPEKGWIVSALLSLQLAEFIIINYKIFSRVMVKDPRNFFCFCHTGICKLLNFVYVNTYIYQTSHEVFLSLNF